MRGSRGQVILDLLLFTWLMQQRVWCFLVKKRAYFASYRMISAGAGDKLFPTVQEWATKSADNSFLQRLIEEKAPDGMGQFDTRQVHRAHFVRVKPEKVRDPSLVIASETCAASVGLSMEAVKSQAFVDLFVGNQLPPGLDSPWASVYGCHCYGQWFGQLGDGRAMSVGEVTFPITFGNNADDNNDDLRQETRTELQLKGCGRTPFSRGFDGKAVLRSTVREFLVSEAMHHLGVSTSRALSIISTGQQIRRPWYAAKTNGMMDGSDREYANKNRGGKFSPDTLVREPGAVMCRTAKSFLRFSQLELFAMREEYDELMMLADYVCYREYPHLVDIEPAKERYIELFRCVAKQCAALVTDWMRVGYTQGNMNSDNTLLGGRTVDYGPYGWMETFDPFYQPFTSDSDGKFCFIRQPNAMGININVLGNQVFERLIKHICGEDHEAAIAGCNSIKEIREVEFENYFMENYRMMQKRKLGVDGDGEGNSSTLQLYKELEQLMYRSRCDMTITFRELSKAAGAETPMQGLELLKKAFADYDRIFESNPSGKTSIEKTPDSELWISWFERYLKRVKEDNLKTEERIAIMNSANPKFVLRNWMAVLAYEKAEKGDYSTLQELETLLQSPYEEQDDESTSKWYQRTPAWAEGMPGASFLS